MSEIIDNKGLPEGDSTINFKLINQYQQKYTRLKTKYDISTYHTYSFHGGSNININLITCYDKIVIMSRFKSYILHWYHTYFLHPGMDRTEAIIYQHLYWTIIRKSVRKELTNCDTFQCTKFSNTKYGKLLAKEDEEISCNKICVYIIGPYVIIIKGHK